ncbi:hypothetical protein [Cyclobacterium plantarum]|uniref:hypothetical protein n=1 Tax=Cyclobacterium plantarum TaxID=2716263 RepID=UPI003F7166F6
MLDFLLLRTRSIWMDEPALGVKEQVSGDKCYIQLFQYNTLLLSLSPVKALIAVPGYDLKHPENQ